jgi:aspartate kinase
MSDIEVLKFGGSSFADADSFRAVAAHLAERAAAGARVVAVVSGMPGSTEELRALALTVSPEPGPLHAVLPLADAIGAGLLGVALRALLPEAHVLAFHQLGLMAGPSEQPVQFDPAPLLACLESHPVVVMPGGQALDAAGQLVSLGKNSSDLTAVTVAAGLGLHSCEIYSDVDGIYTADPHLVGGARLVPRVSYRDAHTLAAHGAKVLHPGAVEAAEAAGVEIRCRLNHGDFRPGSVIASRGAAHAVVLDLRSEVIEFPSEALCTEGVSALAGEGAATHRPPSAARHLAAVTGAFFDVSRFLEARDIPGRVTGERLVSVLRDGTVTHHVAGGDEEATALAVAEHTRVNASHDGAQRTVRTGDLASNACRDSVTRDVNASRTPSSTSSSER